MEAILKNLESTSELIAISQTEYVKRWDEGTVERAFQWSDYCEHIYKRFNTNPTIRTAIENRLRQTNELLRRTFTEHRDFTFLDLGRCRDVLLVSLLKNPACPCSVIKVILGSFKPNDRWGDGPVSMGFSDLTGSISFKSAGEVLRATNGNRRDTRGLCVEPLAKGSILREHIQNLLSHNGNESLVRSLLDSLFQPGSENSAPEIIAGVLLSCEDFPAHDVTRNFIFSWLQANPNSILNMCQALPVLTLTELAQQSEGFWLAYMGILKNWALALSYDVTVGEWVASEGSGVPFTALTEHFRSLLSSGHSLERETLRELRELKEGDGGFEERGLSVWGDVLSELSTGQRLPDAANIL
ncbi:Fanconi anemia group F protein [Alosa alosa]|uniref:Fanconi anemia group F protein n=1 Tax=Alosa alosa TaxID=278164 RepID=UPI00201526AE|nr:Fanconi anemia group F protein [Alosa alosa]